MNQRQLRKLSKNDLMELLLEQGKQIRDLEQRLERAESALAERTLLQEDAGTMAEAALRLTGAFQAVDEACKLYLENIQRRSREAGDAQ